MAHTNDQAASLRQAVAERRPLQSKKASCCIAVASGKGGVGKTFISVNLSVAFAQAGKKVLLVDSDLGLANADIVLGVNPKYTLQDAIFRGRDLADVVEHTQYGVDLIAASSGSKEMVSMGQARVALFIKELISFASQYDVIIFDCAAGIDHNVTSFIAATPLSVIVTTPQPTALMDVYALIKLIYQDNLSSNVGVVVNSANSYDQGKGVVKALNQVTQSYLSKSVELLGVVGKSDLVHSALHQRKPFIEAFRSNPVSNDIRDLAKHILEKQQGAGISEIDPVKLMSGLMKPQN